MKSWPDRILLQPISRVAGEVLLPGSKSISNRALLLAALAEGETELRNLLHSDDTRYMGEALRQIGISLETEGTTARVVGNGGPFRNSSAQRLFLGNAGTAMRSLTAALALSPGEWEMTGDPRMEERPIGDQIDALRSLGAEITALKNEGYPPLRMIGKQLRGGEVRVKGNASSQFLTALLMTAPLFEEGLTIEVEGVLISKPYIDITLDVMKKFGVEAKRDGYSRFAVPGVASGAKYRSPGVYTIEGDASGASYFLAAGAAAGGTVRVVGAGSVSVQGDVAFAKVLEQMGADVEWEPDAIRVTGGKPLRGVDLDLNHIPDAAMTLATLALFAEGETVLRNIGSWRVKETDRIAAMATELRKVGATVEEGEDWLRVVSAAQLRHAEIATYNDHRMAMCFSLVALAGVPVTILDPICVAKTFPDYFEVLASISG